MKLRPSLAAMAIISTGTASGVNHAAEGGLSNYIPGFYGDIALAVAPPDGLSIRNDLYYYGGEADTSPRANTVQFDAEVTLLYNYVTLLYNPGIDILGGRLAMGATPAIGNVDVEADLALGEFQTGVNDKRTGIGDTTLSGNLYWQQDKLHLMWANYLVTPTGRFNEDDLANTGLNYWTFETDIAATYFNEVTGQDYSFVAGYTYNTENTATNYKSGDEFHVDFVLNQFLSDTIGIGLNGFYYRQLSGDTGEGALLGDFKGEASGIGPAFYYIHEVGKRQVYFSLKSLHEFDVENRPEGNYVYASFALTL